MNYLQEGGEKIDIMKKIYILILIILSMFLVNRSYYEKNETEAIKIYNLNHTLKEEMKVLENYLMIEIDNNDYQDIMNDILSYADAHQTKISTIISYEDELGINTYVNYYLTNINQLSNYINIETHNNNNKYYTTDLSDNQSKGYIKIINNQFFKNTQDIIRIYQLSDINELDYTTNQFGISIFTNQESEVKDFKEFLTKHYPIKQVFDTQADELNYSDDGSIINNYSTTYLGLCIILLISILICIIVKDHKKYLISRMLGHSVLKLVIKNFLLFFVISIIVFVLSNVIGCYIKVGEINTLTRDYFYTYQIVNIYYIIIILFVNIAIYLVIKYTTNIKYLKSNQAYGHLVIVQWISKAVVIVLLVMPVISTFSDSLPYVKNYNSIQNQKDNIENYYQIGGSFIHNETIFNHYIDKEIFCDMEKYYMRSKEGPFYDSEDEYATYYQYEYLEANQYYLQDCQFYNIDGDKINLSDYNENILLIPQQLKEKLDMEIYNPQNYKVIYVKDTGQFFNPKVRYVYVMTNPVICVVKNYSVDVDIQGLLFDKRHKSYNEYIAELEALEGQNLETASLTSCMNSYEFYIDRCQEYIPEFLLIMSIFLLIIICNAYITTRMYLEEFGKVIAIQYMLGRDKKKRYGMLFIFILSSTIIASTVSWLMYTVQLLELINFIFLIICIEVLIIVVMIYHFEKKGIISYLKGGVI